jgi:hypothetical protein
MSDVAWPWVYIVMAITGLLLTIGSVVNGYIIYSTRIFDPSTIVTIISGISFGVIFILGGVGLFLGGPMGDMGRLN